MSIIVTVTPPAATPVVLDPIGAAGALGSNGWTPVLSVEFDGQRAVHKVVDWAGGEDPKPPVGQYVGTGSTLVDDIADGADIRGVQGVQGPQGDPGQILTSGSIFTGDGVPSNTLGVDNDIYIDNLTANLYQKQGGVWVLQTNIKGAKGDKGDTGNAGVAGVAGANGATILVGSGVPNNGVGANGDLYLESITFTLYRKSAGAWTQVGVIKGPAGSSIRVAAGAPSNTLGVDGDSYINSSNGDLYLRTAGTYSLVGNTAGPAGATGAQGPQGIQGPNGSSTLFGTTNPGSGLGANGDSYINTTTYHLFTKSAGAWTDVGSLKGADGVNGIGNAYFVGSGAPGTIPPSIQGDMYIDITNGDLYQKGTGNTWNGPLINLRGPTGATGATGAAGAAGATGATGTSILAGDGAPNNSLGNNGDSYINKLNGDFFGPKASGVWPSSTLNLKGPQGNTGATGSTGQAGTNFLSGAGVPGSGLGVNGDTYLNVTNGDVYGPKASGAWGSAVGSLKGPTGSAGATGSTGATGAAGQRGSVWYSGATTPPGAQTGQLDGDYYMVTGSGQIWKLVGGTWTDQGFAIKGSTGATGAAGQNGATWYQGTSFPTITPTTAHEGDFLFRTDNYNVYQVIGSTWTVIANIKGPQGDAGTAGTNGSNGTNGWSPVFANATDGARRVLQVVDWIGGTSGKPSTTNQFVGSTGFVSTAAAAVDVRGAAGADGSTGATGAAGPSNLPMTSVSAARTIASTDKGTCLFHPSADTTARTWTIDNTSSWTAGDTISFLNQNGAGALTIAISGTSAVLRQVGTTNTGSRTLAANGYATAVRCPDNLTWYISGQGLT